MSKTALINDSVVRGDAHEISQLNLFKDDIEEDPKFKPQSLWDNAPRKLLIYIMEGVGILPPEGGIQIKLRYEPTKTQRLKYKTAPQYSEDPKWNELCYFDISTIIQGVPEDELAKAQLTMAFVSVKKNATIGEAVLCVPTELPEETVFDAWIDFKKTIGKGELGTVHVRALYSSQPETFHANWDWRGLRFDPNRYMYLGMKEKVKTGDLVCYDGIGTLPAITKVVANTSYSRLGLIFEAPSKYSRQNEFYVLEVTRNRDRFQDAFKEARVKGVNIFRLWDRLHQVHANRIWWAPLSSPLPTGGAQKLRDWIWDLHDTTSHKSSIYTQALPQPIISFLETHHWSPQKFESELGELFSGRLVLQALAVAGVKFLLFVSWNLDSADSYTAPIAVMTRQLYEEPVLIRAPSERRDTVSIHAHLEVQSSSSPMVAPKVNSNTSSVVPSRSFFFLADSNVTSFMKPKLDVPRAETPLKNQRPSSPTLEERNKHDDTASPRGNEKKPRKDTVEKKDESKPEKKKERESTDDIISPRTGLSRVLSRSKREKKEDDSPQNSAATSASPLPMKLIEFPLSMKLRELSKKLAESEDEQLEQSDLNDKLKDCGFENNQASSALFNALREDEKASSVKFGQALAIALTWIISDEPLSDRVNKAFEVASIKKISKSQLATFGLEFFYFGAVILSQLCERPQVSGLSVEAVEESITDPLFDEEWEMASATAETEEGDEEVTNSLMSALGKKSLKRSRSAGESSKTLNVDRIVKWFKREQAVPLLNDLEKELTVAHQTAVNNANIAASPPSSPHVVMKTSSKGDEKEKKKEKTEKDDKKDKADKEQKDKVEKVKKEPKKEKDAYSPRQSSRPTLAKRETMVDVKTKLNPAVIESCAYFFEKNLESEGIFRISGGAKNVDRIFKIIIDPRNMGFNVDNEDVNDVSGAFKNYLRQLDPPIIPFDLFDEAVNWKDDIEYVQTLLKKLPADNLKALERIIRLLTMTAQKSAVNKMDINNLSIVFGPTLIRPAPERESPEVYLQANEKAKNLVVYLTSKFEEVFVGDVLLKMYS